MFSPERKLSDMIFSLFVLALVVTAIVCLTKLWWMRSDDKAHAARCASCAAGVYHGQHDE